MDGVVQDAERNIAINSPLPLPMEPIAKIAIIIIDNSIRL
jgi:hypothetical protein